MSEPTVPRLFFALPIPESITDTLDGLCEGVPRARWALENDYHITLCFLGDVPAQRFRDAVEVAKTIRRAPFELAIRSVGAFPTRGQPRVLWAGLEKQDALFGLQRALQNELRHAGFQLERRKYRPHITLARVHDSPQLAILEWLAHHMGLEISPFKAFRFHLYSSSVGASGSHYRIEETFRLQGLV